MKNGTIRWVPGDGLRAACARGGVTLPDVLTDGLAENGEIGPYVHFPDVSVAVNGKPDLKLLWDDAIRTSAS
jgi:hypothetical protein